MRSVWADITRDPVTGHTVAKDLYKALSFFAGLGYLLVLVPTVVLLTPANLVLPLEPGMALVTLAFGFQTLKEVSRYFQRKTADSAGQVLVEPGTVPPVVMPQVLNPNFPPTAAADAC